MKLTPEDRRKQIFYRDARFTDKYDGVWQSVGKCVFCDMRDKYIIFEENGVVLSIVLYAYIDGHMFIIPRRHVTNVKELTNKEWNSVRKLMYIAKKLARKAHGAKGMQYVQKDGAAAQSTVEHIHFHCVPFDKPDLSYWNYRKLKYTPLQNAMIYQNLHDKTAELSAKFDKKYAGD